MYENESVKILIYNKTALRALPAATWLSVGRRLQVGAKSIVRGRNTDFEVCLIIRFQ